MKNSSEYSKKVQKLYRSLKRKYPKVKKVIYDEPADALVYALISENLTEAESQSAIKRFADYFVDLNDLRVSRAEEIIEMLGVDNPVTKQIAFGITEVLRVIFEKNNLASLSSLKKMSKRPARQLLEKTDGITHFMVNYCMLTSLDAHAIPLTKKMIEYLKNNELVDPEADDQQIEGFLARQISVENAYEFYSLLRRASELRSAKKKSRKKTTATRKTKK